MGAQVGLLDGCLSGTIHAADLLLRNGGNAVGVLCCVIDLLTRLHLPEDKFGSTGMCMQVRQAAESQAQEEHLDLVL